MLSLLMLLSVAAPQNPGDVVINEISYDDSSTDDFEFVELYNTTNAPINIGGWMLAAADDLGPNLSYTISAGAMLAPGAYYVAGASTVTNVTQALVDPATSMGINLFENGEEYLRLETSSGQVIDRIDYETYASTWVTAGREGSGVPGGSVAAGGVEMSLQRYTDGYDTDDNGNDFRLMPWTPGATNNVTNIVPYLGFFDIGAPGTAIPEFGGSFVEARIIDPTQLAGGNPTPIPPSPQGGSAAIFFDPTGGGNHNPLLTQPLEDVTLECFAYFETTMLTGATDGESWSIGVRGACDSFGHHPMIDPRWAMITGVSTWIPGQTGISIVMQRTQQYHKLWVVDWNNGGDDFVVLHELDIVAGMNDGWQRMRLRVIGEFVEFNFGGTFGANDGVVVSARTQSVMPGGVYVGYREFLVNNAQWRPITLDSLTVVPGRGEVHYTGAGAPHSGGTPEIDLNSFPFVGNGNFGIDLSTLLPNQPATLIGGFGLLASPINLGLFGGVNNAFLYVNSNFSAPVVADGMGNASVPLAIPAIPGLLGATLEFQSAVIDATLGVSIPVVTSRAVGFTIGG